MISTKARAVSAPTPGWVIRRCAAGHFVTSASIACVSSAIAGFSRSSNSNKSPRRRLPHAASGKDSSCCCPFSRHNLFLQRSPSFSATACNWFMISRAHLHHPVPVPQQLPHITIFPARHPDPWKPILHQQAQNMASVLTIGLLLSYSPRSNLGGIADPQLDLQLGQQSLEPPRLPATFHPQPYLHSLLGKLAIELLRLLPMLQSSLLELTSVCVHPSNVLSSRVIIATYNDHLRLLSPGPWLVSTTKFTRAWEPTLSWNQYGDLSPTKRRCARTPHFCRVMLTTRPSRYTFPS